MKCKTCGKEQHYCSSCSYQRYVGSGYCNRQCFLNSEEYRNLGNTLNTLYDSLTWKQKDMLFTLWDNGVLYNDDVWEPEVDEVIVDPGEEEDYHE